MNLAGATPPLPLKEEGWIVSSHRDSLQSSWGLVTWRFFQAGMPTPSQCMFVLDESMHDSKRHFGGCLLDGSEVRIAPSLAAMPREIVLGVLAHEAGHCQDLNNPKRYGAPGGRLREYVNGPRHRRTSHETEVVADLLASEAMGERIGYVQVAGVGWIQCLGQGVSRPKGLR